MARLRLVLIPFAGAGAGVFAGWGGLLGPSIDAFALQLPGREDAGGAPFTSWREMIADAAAAVAALPPGPLAFFGHSLGALIALDLARAFASRTDHLFCAARPWPGAPAPDALLDIARMTEVYGAPPPSFDNPEIRDYALPILKSDLQLLRSYAYPGPAGLACPLAVFAGDQDPATKDADLTRWRAETSGPTDIVTLPAGHYFLAPLRARLAGEISARLGADA
jgi:surfactin synthase thioesterase subunit